VKRFACLEVTEAKAYAAAGGQALHCHRIIFDDSPRCFKAAVAQGEDIGHLFDQDARRLVATARRLGVRVILVERRGTLGQHIDLCGAPMRRALAECQSQLFEGAG
jgi:hypothetical protein